MVKNWFIKTLVIVTVIGFTFTSCDKKTDSSTTVDASTSQTSTDQATSDGDYNDASSTTDDVLSSQSSLLGAREDGTTATYDRCATAKINIVGPTTTTYENTAMSLRTVTVDFGTGCSDDSTGRVRKGKMNIAIYIPVNTELSQRKYNSFTVGSIVVTTFDGYFVNNRKIEGTHIVRNQTTVSQPVNGVRTVTPIHRITVQNGKVTFADGKTVTYASDRIRTWSAGFATRTFTDDEFTISAVPASGSTASPAAWSGTNRNGETFSFVINTAMVYKLKCSLSPFRIFKAVSGNVTVTTGTKVATVDYGDGSCDKKVTVTINGKTYTTNTDSDS